MAKYLTRSSADAPPRYQLTVLPLTFYSLSRHGSGLNNQGQVVGVSSLDSIARGKGGSPLLRLALWQRGKKQWLLFSAQEHLDLDRSSTAAGINDRGQVIGNFQVISFGAVTSYSSNAFLWAKGSLVDIPLLPGDDYCAVQGLNNHGEAVGTAATNAGLSHAFIYRRGKTINQGVGSASGINDQSWIIGEGHVDTGPSPQRTFTFLLTQKRK